VRQLLGTANVIPSSPILVTLIMEAQRSSETSVLTRATGHNISEEGILYRIIWDIKLTFFKIVSFRTSKFHGKQMLQYLLGRIAALMLS
jgi:hypothetical protein